jgi:predicted Rossmann fold flavoprotein
MIADICDLVIAGGGAAGFFAAIACAEHSSRPLRILILEKSSRPLGKVLISGGGRCNLTHACYEPARLVEFYPRGGAALRSAFTRFQPRDTVAWFERHGVPLTREADGRIFPASDSAQTVVDCLLQAAQQAGVELWTQHAVTSVELSEPFFTLLVRPSVQAEMLSVSSRCLLLATGGDYAALRLAAELGHTIEPPVPSLFTFTLADPRLARLAGVSVPRVGLSLLEEDGSLPHLPGMRQSGALLVTHTGLSGPVVLRLSAWGARWLHEHGYRAGLAINWVTPRGTEAVLNDLQAYKSDPARARRKPVQRALFGLPLRLWHRLLEATGVTTGQNWGDLSKVALRRLADELTDGRYTIQGKGLFKDEFVTCGGVRLDEVDFKTMQSKRLPGLYFAGEALDVDGLTGGFNFQNAWTTGWLAGQAIARRLEEG